MMQFWELENVSLLDKIVIHVKIISQIVKENPNNRYFFLSFIDGTHDDLCLDENQFCLKQKFSKLPVLGKNTTLRMRV